MARRGMVQNDIGSMRWSADVQLSPDGQQLAWTESSLDLTTDQPTSQIMLASVDGRRTPRPFTFGPGQFAPRFSPDGAFLAYLSAEGGPPALHIAPLDGGVPLQVKSDGPVASLEWLPDGRRLALVVLLGARAAGETPLEKNRPSAVRGSFNRLDGLGPLSGRAQVVVYDVELGSMTQLTQGDYDCEQPSFSPDGRQVVYLSDRSPRRDDVIGRTDVFVVPVSGGRARRLAAGVGFASNPTFSPDGRTIALVGVEPGRGVYGRSRVVLTLRASGGGTLRRAVPGVDHTVSEDPPACAYAWLSNRELALTVNERGSVRIYRSVIGSGKLRRLVGGELCVGSFSVAGSRAGKVLAYTSAWVEGVSDVRVRSLDAPGRGRAVTDHLAQLSKRANLAPARRRRIRSVDGLDIEFLVLTPPDASKPLPCVVDVHGGPQMSHPFVEVCYLYQCLVGAGYAVVLPNPRGSLGYGEAFSHMVVGDWGGKDFLDLMAVCDNVVERGVADPRRLFLSGYSYGGYMSSWAVTQTQRFSAAVIGAPVTDLVSMFGASDAGALIGENLGGDPWRGVELLAQRSPVLHAGKVRTPVLLHVHEGDLRCPPSQSDELFVALRQLRRTVEYVRYPGGSHLSILPFHGPPSQNIDRIDRITQFLSRYGGPRRRTPRR